MDIPDSLSPLLPIIHRFWQILRVTSRILTELLYVGTPINHIYTLQITNYGRFINQFPPNIIKSIRQFKRINKKNIYRQKMSIMFNQICINEEMQSKYIYIYICIYIYIDSVCVCVCVCYIYIYIKTGFSIKQPSRIDMV